MTKVLSTQKSIPQSCTSKGFSSMYKLTGLQPHWGEEEQRLMGTHRAGWQHHRALSSRDQPSCSPGQVWPIPQPSGDELHPLSIPNRGQQSATSHVSASSAHSPSPAPSPVPLPTGTLGLPQTSTRCFSFCTRSSGTGCAFPCLLRHFWSPQQPGYRITR